MSAFLISGFMVLHGWFLMEQKPFLASHKSGEGCISFVLLYLQAWLSAATVELRSLQIYLSH